MQRHHQETQVPVAQRIRHLTTNQGILGSNPSRDVPFFLPGQFLQGKTKKRPPPAGFEPATPGLEVRCAIQLRHGGERPWWDSNPQPLDPKSSALSIAPQGHVLFCGLVKLFCRLTFFESSFKKVHLLRIELRTFRV